MPRKSNFTTDSEVPDDHFFDTFGNGVNRKISKENLFKQIKKQAQTYYYDSEDDLKAAKLEADPDSPIYVRVAPSWRLYRITSLAPVAPYDIALNNGATATLDRLENLRASTVEDMKTIPFLKDGDFVDTINFETTGDKGGNTYEIGTFGTADGVFIIDLTGTSLQARRVNRVDIEVDTVSEMESLPFLYIDDDVSTLGYTDTGDGGGNDYKVVAAGTGTADGGSYIDLPGSGLQARGLFPLPKISVKQFGAVGDGVSDDSSAISGAQAYAKVQERPLLHPSGTYLRGGTLYTILGSSTYIDSGFTTGVNPTLSGSKSALFLTGETENDPVFDDLKSKTLVFVTAVARGSQNANGFRANLNNYSDLSAGNTAFYGRAASDTGAAWQAAQHGETRHGGGISIGLSSESACYSTTGSFYGIVANNTTSGAEATNPVTGLPKQKHPSSTGLFVQGTQDADDWGNWIFGVRFSAASINSAGYAIRDDSDSAATLWTTGVSSSSIADIYLQGISNFGAIFNGTYASGTAIRLDANSAIAFESTNTIKLSWDNGVSRLTLKNAGVERVGLISSATPGIALNSTKVLGTRRTGWTTPTGTVNRGGFDTSTVTTEVLAQHLLALLNDLGAAGHGLIDA